MLQVLQRAFEFGHAQMQLRLHPTRGTQGMLQLARAADAAAAAPGQQAPVSLIELRARRIFVHADVQLNAFQQVS